MANHFILKASTSLTLMGLGLVAGIPQAQAAGLSGTIGLGFNIDVVGLGLCAPLSNIPPAIPCNDSLADTTKPVTTLDAKFLVTSPEIPGFGEVTVSDATGDFTTIDPPPLRYGVVKDIPFAGDFTPDGFLELAALVASPSSPPFRYVVDLLTLSFPQYSETTAGSVTTSTISLNYTGIITDRLTGRQGLATGAFSSDFTQGDSVFPGFDGTNAALQAYLRISGNTITGISASTTMSVTPLPNGVPEPASVLGVMMLGLGGVATKVRKSVSKN